MTSGLPDYYTVPRQNGRTWSPYDQFTVGRRHRGVARGRHAQVPPGARWDYSNVNYMLLTKVVEKASGLPFADFATGACSARSAWRTRR
jgi:CubicO group peptidase (beta-lactamase class C family)